MNFNGAEADTVLVPAVATAIRLGVPDVRDVYTECGAFAGGIYGLRTFVYMRTTKQGTERVVVMNGMVVQHNETDCITDKLVQTSIPSLVGKWAWGLGLKKQFRFSVVQSMTLAEGLKMFALPEGK